MNSISQSRLLTCLPALYLEQNLSLFPAHLAQWIARLVPAECVGFNEVNLKRQRVLVTLYPQAAIGQELLQAFESRMHEHPLILYQRRSGDLSAHMISDFQSTAQFHRLSLYQEFFRPIRTEDQLALSLRAGPTILALALNRKRRNFTEADRETLNLLSPHLVQAYRNAERLTELRDELDRVQTDLDQLPLGLAVLDRSSRIRLVNSEARRLLQEYFGARMTSRFLPDSLRTWITRRSNWQGQALPIPVGTFSMAGAGGTLTVHCGATSDGHERFLIFRERALKQGPKGLLALGLTSREAEVLWWVAQGKTNPEIGIILDAASRTIQKHLEHIFAKLCVESRTAAARTALETLDS